MKGRIDISIPDYQSILLPLLKQAQDSKEHSSKEAADVLAELVEKFNIIFYQSAEDAVFKALGVE